MPKPSLALSSVGPDVVRETPVREVHLPLDGRLPQAACGDKVLKGQRIAESLAPFSSGEGDLHAPFSGEILAVSSEHVAILAGGSGETVPPAALSTSSGEALAAALKRLGVASAALRPAQTLVVGGLEPEPGVGVAAKLLGARRETLEAGLELAVRVIGPEKRRLVLPHGSKAGLPGCEPVFAAPVYPNGLGPMAIRAATGLENPADAVFLAVHELFALGRVAESGLPLAETAISAGEELFCVPLGTPAGELVKAAGLKAADGDRVVLGGPMRGRALYGLAQGVGPGDYALTVIPRGSFPRMTDSPCLNCGECVMVCPARILPGMISRCAEFKLFERTVEYHIDACMDCGLCGFVCVGRRPVLQYIRLAKKELADQRNAACETSEEEASSCSGKR